MNLGKFMSKVTSVGNDNYFSGYQKPAGTVLFLVSEVSNSYTDSFEKIKPKVPEQYRNKVVSVLNKYDKESFKDSVEVSSVVVNELDDSTCIGRKVVEVHGHYKDMGVAHHKQVMIIIRWDVALPEDLRVNIYKARDEIKAEAEKKTE